MNKQNKEGLTSDETSELNGILEEIGRRLMQAKDAADAKRDEVRGAM